MIGYFIRRILYAFPILLGVNLLIFLLFFYIQSPDDMAETFLGSKRVTREMKDNWKREHGYHLPRLLNTAEPFPAAVTQTVFWQKNAPLFVFRFGTSDMDGSRIGAELARRIPYSLCLTAPILLVSLAIYVTLAMIVAFYRATYIDTWTLVVCVLMMSISTMFYILGGQYLFAIKLKLAPVSGFDRHLLHALKFLVLPIVIGIVTDIGGGVRYYRTVFLEEIGKDYVRTARAKGLGEGKVLFKHALKNAMFPILTNVVVGIPFLIMGMLLMENFFGIPGLGNYMIDAIHKQDFAVVRAMVFLGSFLYILGLILVDLSYTLFDPRVRLP
jgi:peptide/nickel transport system permease protein